MPLWHEQSFTESFWQTKDRTGELRLPFQTLILWASKHPHVLLIRQPNAVLNFVGEMGACVASNFNTGVPMLHRPSYVTQNM